METSKIVVLNDGETFSDLNGCVVAEVLWTGDDPDEFDEKLDELYEVYGEDLWESAEDGIIAKIVSTMEV